jgi:hypothetical protein
MCRHVSPFPKVRILDTPGLADTRSIQHDEIHKQNIATQIKQYSDSITAILILTNGTVPRVTVGTDYALSTLSTLFPQTLAANISFMFTNVLSQLHRNFSLDSVPSTLRHAPQFLLNNPIALQRKHIKIKNDTNVKRRRTDLRSAVKAGEQNALKTLVRFFDWLDSLEPQGTTESVRRPQKSEARSTGPLTPTDQMGTHQPKNSSVGCLPGTRFLYFSFSLRIGSTVFSQFIQISMVSKRKEVNIAPNKWNICSGTPTKCGRGSGI